MRLHNTVLSLIGGTPLARVRSMAASGSADILAKLEGYNPGGSVKDRIALNMIETAESDRESSQPAARSSSRRAATRA